MSALSLRAAPAPALPTRWLALAALGFAATAPAATPGAVLESLPDAEALQMLRELPARLESLQALTPSIYESLDAMDRGDDAAGGGVSSEVAIDEHRPLNADGHLRVSNVAGSVVLSTWSRNEVAISGELGAGADKLEITGDAGSLNVAVKLPRRSHNIASTDLKLSVPVGAHVEVETVSADVSARDIAGPVKVNTVSGEVALQLASPEVTVQTVSGDLTVSAPAHLTRINSVSGDVKLGGMQDKLYAETVSGNVQLDGGRFTEMHLKSVSGDMRVNASFAPQAQINGETLSGNITMAVPQSLSGTARLKSFSGDTRCDGAQTVSLKKHEYVLGSGADNGVKLELSSFSGDIHVEKK